MASKIVYAVLASLVIVSIAAGIFRLAAPDTHANHTQCSDGIDNDDNGKTDYPQDTGCQTLDDDYEGAQMTGNFITVTDDRESIGPGGALVYAVTLKQQRDNQRVINAELHLPHQANIVSASDGGEVHPGYVIWRNISVYKNVTRRITVNVNVTPDARQGDYIVARARAAGTEATDTTLIDSTISRPVSGAFSVNLDANKQYVLPGEDIRYRLRVRNVTNNSQTSDVRLTVSDTTYILDFAPSDNSRKDSSTTILWKDMSFGPLETKEFSASVKVERRTKDHYAIYARASVGGENDTVVTTARVGLPDNALTVSITDNRSSVRVGDLVTHTILVKNSASIAGTHVNVNASLPQYAEFVSATEGGYWDSKNVRWLEILVAPSGKRTLQYTYRVRRDAPLQALMATTVKADNANARDITVVGSQTVHDVYTSPEVGGPVYGLITKTSDRNEITPGGRIHYRLYVRNNLDRAIINPVVTDRFEAKYLRIVSAGNEHQIISRGDGEIKWRLPTLQPGQTWEVAYTLSALQGVPPYYSLRNTATITANDLTGTALTETVATGSAGVLGAMPQTGVGMDAIAAIMFAMIAFGFAGIQRKFAIMRV